MVNRDLGEKEDFASEEETGRMKREEGMSGVRMKSFLDMIAPGVIRFYADYYVCGNSFRSVWALREYPTATDEQAILKHLGDMDGVTLRIEPATSRRQNPRSGLFKTWKERRPGRKSPPWSPVSKGLAR